MVIMQMCLWTCLKHHLWITSIKKTAKKPAIWLRFIDWIFFCLNKQWRLDQKNFSVLREMQWKKKNSLTKLEISQSTQTNQFLRSLHHHKSGNLIYHRVFKNDGPSHPPYSEHMIKNIPKSQFLRLRRICSNTSD